jgi:uncharacterized membrane protein YphA (DoxX/SURF4 family)
MKALPLLNWFCRLVLGAAFIYAGVSKIGNPAQFALNVSHYRLLPADLVNIVAIILPWVEVLAGLCVLTGFWLRSAALLLSGLTLMFSVVIISALARGLNIECGCFGTLGGARVGLRTLAIDAILFALAFPLTRRPNPVIDPLLQRPQYLFPSGRSPGPAGTPQITAAVLPAKSSTPSSHSNAHKDPTIVQKACT